MYAWLKDSIEEIFYNFFPRKNVHGYSIPMSILKWRVGMSVAQTQGCQRHILEFRAPGSWGDCKLEHFLENHKMTSLSTLSAQVNFKFHEVIHRDDFWKIQRWTCFCAIYLFSWVKNDKNKWCEDTFGDGFFGLKKWRRKFSRKPMGTLFLEGLWDSFYF